MEFKEELDGYEVKMRLLFFMFNAISYDTFVLNIENIRFVGNNNISMLKKIARCVSPPYLKCEIYRYFCHIPPNRNSIDGSDGKTSAPTEEPYGRTK